jgi:RNA polymerase sigma-70 factor (ECF subfamily)
MTITSPPLDAASVFGAERPRLVGLAYRLLGSMTDAEDVVQDAWLRWQASGAAVERPAAWLTTVVTRLGIDRLRSARHQRETYIGPWLPEPVSATPGPSETAEVAESLTISFLALLERLTPLERAVFLLADVFDEPYRDIATTVGRSEEACRQIASRARRRVRDSHRHVDDEPQAGDRLRERFVAAAIAGDVDALLAILAPDVVLVSDGGPHRRAARYPVRGAYRVTRLVTNLVKRFPATAGVSWPTINGEPAIVVDARGVPSLVLVLHVEDGKIAALYALLNPLKLGYVGGTQLPSATSRSSTSAKPGDWRWMFENSERALGVSPTRS